MDSVQHDQRPAESTETVVPPNGDRRKRTDVMIVILVSVLVAPLLVSAVAVRRSNENEVVEPAVRTIRMAGDSEYFTDPDVQRELERNGFRVEQNRKGSVAIADLPNLATAYDVANAGSDIAAKHIIKVLYETYHVDNASSRSPFSSPMVIVTYQPIVALLGREKLGIAHQSVNGTWVFDISAYLDCAKQQKRWSDIPDNTAYQSIVRVLITITDPTQSNSGGMLMAIETFVANGNSVVDNVDTFKATKPEAAELIKSTYTGLGTKLDHTPDLLTLFQRDGMNRYPMVMLYEKDYINTKLRSAEAMDQVVLMYPNPTVYADNTIVWWSRDGQDFANMLSTNPVLIDLAMKHGYHVAGRGPAQFAQDMANKGVIVANLDDVRHTEVTVVGPPDEKNLIRLNAELSK